VNPDSARPDGDHVDIRVPANGAFIATLRLAAASLAARCDLTVDDIEDLRLAVDEACSLLLQLVRPEEALYARFLLAPGELRVETSVHTPEHIDVDRGGFAWTVLGALASSVDVGRVDGRLVISVVKRRETATP
jgi:serine/threonine-protein kinase RsbW